MARDFRSTHLPLSPARVGPEVVVIPNRARALWNRETAPLDAALPTRSRHVIEEHDEHSAPALSFRLYGTKDWWWILCLVNAVIDPTRELDAGREIEVPDRNEIETWLSASVGAARPRFETI